MRLYSNSLFLIFITFILFLSCNNEAFFYSKLNEKFKSLDMDNAELLFIQPQTDSRGAVFQNQLMKIKKDGGIVAVMGSDLADQDFDVSSLEIPGLSQTLFLSGMKAVSNEYLVLFYNSDNVTSADKAEVSFLVRKDDGSVFSLTSLGRIVSTHPVYHVKPLDKLYMLSGDSDFDVQTIVQVSLNHADSLFASIASPEGVSVNQFIVDNQGNMIYENMMGEYRLLKITREVESIDIDKDTKIWIGQNGQFYHFLNGVVTELLIFKDGTVHSVLYNKLPETENIAPVLNNGLAWPLFYCQNKMFFLGQGDNHLKIVELWNQDGTMMVHSFDQSGDIPDIDKIQMVEVSDSQLYIHATSCQGDLALWRFDPVEGTLVQILVGYEFFSLDVSADDSIRFSALRYSDAVKIVGGFESADLITDIVEPIVIDESLNKEIFELIRIQ